MADLKMLIYDMATIVYVLIAVAIFVPWALLSLSRYDPGFLFISDTIYRFFSFFCHQLPYRSLFLDGIKMPVCARCASIYIATALGLVFFRLKGYGRREFKMNWLLFALLFIPTALDGFTQPAPQDLIRRSLALPRLQEGKRQAGRAQHKKIRGGEQRKTPTLGLALVRQQEVGVVAAVYQLGEAERGAVGIPGRDHYQPVPGILR